MTSGKLFFNLMRDDMKDRIWSVFLAVFIFFITLPVAFLLGYPRAASEASILRQTIGLANPFLPVVTVVGAVICALNGFSYLHSRTKVDFRHSLPVRREMLFAAKYLNGILIYLAALLINMAVTLLLCASRGLLNADTLTTAYMSILLHTTAYWLFYSIALVTVFLTGHILVNLMGVAVFYLYGICVSFLKFSLMSTFFRTVCDTSGYDAYSMSLYTGGPWVSPINAYIRLVADPQTMIFLWIAAAAFSVLALLLYRIRPSEAAGHPMAFPKTEPVFKLLLIVPLVLGGGLFFNNMAYESNLAWFYFGMVLLWFAGCIFIEVIFAFDFRKALARKGSSLVCLALAAAILTVLRMDLLGYDTYVPKKSDVESMAVFVPGLDNGISTFEPASEEPGGYVYTSPLSFRLKHMELTDFSDAYTLALAGAKDAGSYHRSGEQARRSAYETTSCFTFFVKYHLKNGRNVFRRYTVPMSIYDEGAEYYECLSRIYADEQYKKGVFPFLQYEQPEDIFTDITFTTAFGTSQEISLSRRERERLAAAFREELLHTSLEASMQQPPLGSLRFSNQKDFSFRGGDYPVYSGYTKTLALMEEFGISCSVPDSTGPVQLDIHPQYAAKAEALTAEPASEEALGSEEEVLIYQDSDQIARLLDCLVSGDGNAWFYHEYSCRDYYTAYLSYETGDGDYLSSGRFYLDMEKAPDFLKKDLGL